jgi:preprotein translocase subunit YajC
LLDFLGAAIGGLVLLAQAGDGGGAAPAAAPAGGAPAGGGGGGFLETLLGSGMLLPLVATMLLMYFLLMRPEQKKRKEMAELLANLKKNDKVVTIGGILGTVVAASPDAKYVTIRVDEGTKIRVLRTAISQIGGPDEAEPDAKPAA